jgi:hypothetical protein
MTNRCWLHMRCMDVNVSLLLHIRKHPGLRLAAAEATLTLSSRTTPHDHDYLPAASYQQEMVIRSCDSSDARRVCSSDHCQNPSHPYCSVCSAQVR